MEVSDNGASPEADRRVSYVASTHFPTILRELNATLLVSTYQAGKLAVIGSDVTQQGKLDLSIHNFELAMGVAASPREIVVGSRQQIYFLQRATSLASRIAPEGKFDDCYLTRRSHFTGNVHIHEMAFAGDELWFVNTLFSCLCTLHDEYHFVPRWRPPFVSVHFEPEDRCHLNGLALENGKPKFVTVMAETDTKQGWRPNKAESGCVLDVESGETVTRGLAMPHSPRVIDGRLLALDSGRGQLVEVDRSSGRRTPIETFPGYCRGFGLRWPFAFIGLSKIRETAVFGGVPIAENRSALKCGIAAVDLRIGRTVATFEFTEGVEELFSVEVLPDVRCAAVRGPHLSEDGHSPIWVTPPPNETPRRQSQNVSSVSQTGQTVAPADWRALQRQATQMHQAGRADAAVALLKQAIAVHDRSAETFNLFGNALQDVGRQEAALDAYRRAVAIDPNYVPAHQNLGYLLMNHGEPDEAVRHYEAAEKAAPTPMNRVLIATALPVVYESIADVDQRRANLERKVAELVAEDVRIDTANTLVPTSFFLAYQGRNDRDVLRNLARVYHGPNVCEERKGVGSGKRMKVGFLSAYFRDHTIGRLNLGRIQRLPRDRYETFVISTQQGAGDFVDAFRAAGDHYAVTPRKIDVARRMIGEMQLDALVFTDVGMDAVSSTLAHSRMAPVQCVTWGHPSTTGSPMMDYFLSIELGETFEADQHYSERLVRMPSLGIFYERPTKGPLERDRSRFGLDEKSHVYLCPQTLFKFHPEFDWILGQILSRDPLGQLVLLEGRVANWTRQLERRFARTIPDVRSRIRFLPAQPRPAFLSLLASADVLLDPTHFGGGNTTLEALSVGAPVVTLPSPYLKGRLTAATYRYAGYTDLIAKDPADYVEKCLTLASDATTARRTRAAILESCGRLYDDPAAISDWDNFFQTLRG